MNHDPQFTTHGAGVVLLQDQQVLLVQMNYGKFKGQWILPGGMLEPAEFPHQAAQRETLEETGLNIEINKLNKAIVSKQ